MNIIIGWFNRLRFYIRCSIVYPLKLWIFKKMFGKTCIKYIRENLTENKLEDFDNYILLVKRCRKDLKLSLREAKTMVDKIYCKKFCNSTVYHSKYCVHNTMAKENGGYLS